MTFAYTFGNILLTNRARTTLTHPISKRVCAVTAFTAGVLFAAAESQAAGWIIDFEEFLDNTNQRTAFQHGQIVDNEYGSQIISTVGNDAGAGVGVTISAVNRANSGHDHAVIFNSTLNSTRDSDLEDPFFHVSDPNHTGQTYSQANGHAAGNILILQEHDTGSCDNFFCNKPDDEGDRPAGHFIFDFNVPVDLTEIDFFDVEVAENGAGSDNEILFFDEQLQPIGPTLHTPNTGGDNQWARLTMNVTGVSRMIIELKGSGGIDRIVGDTTNTDNVPEADGAAVFGLGVLGLMLARRRRSNAMGSSA